MSRGDPLLNDLYQGVVWYKGTPSKLMQTRAPSIEKAKNNLRHQWAQDMHMEQHVPSPELTIQISRVSTPPSLSKPP